MKINQMKWAGYAACIWSLLYIPIHIYWALGETTLMPGVWKVEAKWAAVNWRASVVLLAAAIFALLLVHPWGQKIPRYLMLAMGWFACVLPITHAVYGYITKGLFLAGVIPLEFFDFSASATIDIDYMILIDLLLFEPWFLIAGILFGSATLQYQSKIKEQGPF
ncbi:DUF3995 domain-containing protein [Peribacillus butanolivorans]|uniref:DUF3995 domain-containing protein n=1 Tax=Peribacillus butanolivorans TaxID=421767 RepID=UPI00207CB5C6|nr:DUF3995 domain-containing protein [Peribacillus butanolivorans]MCO0599973.1 DUF3995 domain-containing protein [Peribacillus butanolivorans]